MNSNLPDLDLSDDEFMLDWGTVPGAYDDKPLKKATKLLYGDICRTVEPYPSWPPPQLENFLKEVSKGVEDLANSNVPLVGLADKSHVSNWKDADIDLLFEIAVEIGEEQGLAWTTPIQAERKELCMKLSKLEELAAELKLLDRLMDRRQPQINNWPRKVRRMKNVGDGGFAPSIHQEAAFRRLWLRVLHIPGLIGNLNDSNLISAECTNLVQAWYMWRISFILTRAESARCPVHQTTDLFFVLTVPYLQWIPDIRTKLKEYITRIKDIIVEGRPADDDELGGHMKRRLEDVNVLLQVKQVTEQFLSTNPLQRLILDLLQREYDFEYALSEDHVEDTLVNKQVTLFNEREFTDEFSWTDVDYTTYGQARAYKKYEASLHKVLRDVTQFNRQRYAHRLLQDWRGQRPWYKMYQLYDTVLPENQWLKAAIRDFKRRTLAFVHDDSPIQTFGEENPPPTDPRRKAARLLGIHPIDFQEEDSLRGEDEMPAGCTVCKQTFTPGSTVDNTVVFLHCRHLFHLKCIFEFWDAPGRYLHSCPTCGFAPSLNWQLAEVDPEEKEIKREWVHNLFGYETDNMTKTAKHPSKRLRALYDVPERPKTITEARQQGPNGYWIRENMNTLMLLDQKENKQVPFWGAGLIGQPGQPGRFQLGGRAIPYKDWKAETEQAKEALDEMVKENSSGDFYQRLAEGRGIYNAVIASFTAEEQRLKKEMSDVAALWEGREVSEENIRERTRFRVARDPFPAEQAARNRRRIEEVSVLDPRERYLTSSQYFMLPGTRFSVEQERSYLRMKRRARNARGVERMKEQNQGLFGLDSRGI